MGVLGEGSRWCFCSGGGRSERMKDSIFASKGLALASISIAGGGSGDRGGSAGTGFLIHRNLLLTTHAGLPSAAAAEAVEIQLFRGCAVGRLVPQRFFITSSILDLTIVGLDILDDDSTSQVQQPFHLKICCHPNLDLGNLVYLLGHTMKKELKIGEAKIVVATDNLIKLSTDGVPWCPGSAGFDVQGNLAFMICDPMKLALSPAGRSPTSSLTALSQKKDTSAQFGIPISVICDWLYQHWEGNLDEVSKPKLPAVQLMSMGLKTRRVSKVPEEVNDAIALSPLADRRYRHQFGPSCSSNSNAMFCPNEELVMELDCIRDQGIPTPEIFESPKLVPGPIQKKERAPVQLLDINFPPKVARSIILPLPLKKLTDENNVKETTTAKRETEFSSGNVLQANVKPEYKLPPVGTWQDHCSDVHSSSSPELLNEWDHCSSEKWAMSELILRPQAMDRAQNEVQEAMKKKGYVEESDVPQFTYIHSVVKETLRLHPPFPLLFPRVGQETTQVLGYTIPAGTRVLINVWALARDPKYWHDAESFKPERFQEGDDKEFKGNDFEFLPFGAGRRMCAGMTFGLSTLELALAQLLFHFDWALPEGMAPPDVDMTETFGASASRKINLHLVPSPRFPLRS